MDQVIGLLQEVVRQDLEACETAIRASDQATAIAAIERAFAKLDTAIDVLRSAPNF
jgi:hypothetical protein